MNKHIHIFSFILGLAIGASMVGTAWAFAGMIWVDANGAPMGTAANPIYIE